MISVGERPSHLLLLGVLLAVHGVALAAYFVPVVSGTDDNGYHVAARLLERHGRIYQTPTDDLSFVGRMWVVATDGHYYPKYPPLYPLLVAGAMSLFGDLGGLLLSPLLAWSSVLGMYLLCRVRGLGGDLALLGAFVMATAPLANSFALTQVSHATSLALVTWGYLLFFAALADPKSRYGTPMLIASGLLLGYAVGVRYTNALLVLPGLAWLLLDRTRQSRRTVTWLLAWLVPCGLVAAYHWHAFGGPLTTAYSLTEEQGGFALSYLVQNLRLYASTVPILLIGPVTILAALGLLLAWRREPWQGFPWVVWFAPLLLTYLAYYWAPEDHARSYVRFLLPLLVPATLLAMEAMSELSRALEMDRRGRLLLIAIVVLCQGSWGIASSLEQMELVVGHNSQAKARVDLVREHAASGAVVIGELDMLDALDYFKDHDLYWVDLLDQRALQQKLDRTLRAGPDSLQLERAEFLRDHLIDVEPAVHEARLRSVIDAPLAEGREVYVVGSGATLETLESFAHGVYRVEKIAGLPFGGRRHLLFEPGRTVSRAAGAGGFPKTPFYIWRLRVSG